MEPVLTHRSKAVVEAARLHRARHRRERGLTLVEGPALIADVAAAGARIVELFTLEAPSDQRFPEAAVATQVDERALARLAGTKNPRGPVAVVEIPEERLEAGRDTLVSVGVSDPGNVGTLIRTAASFGWGYAYLEGSADPWSPKSIRAGGGGQFQTSVCRIESIEELEQWTTVATVIHGGVAPGEIRERPVALLIGEEAHGLDEAMIHGADRRLTISTMGPTESLNAAVAAGIAVYALAKHREGEGGGV